MKFARQSTCSCTIRVPHITIFQLSLCFMKNLLFVSADWTNSFQFRTDCDEYSLVLHRRFSCTIFILAFIVTIITQKETKLQKLAITFHFLSTRDSHCRIQFEKWEIFGYRGTGQRCVKFIVELSLLVWRLKRVAKVGIEQRGK